MITGAKYGGVAIDHQLYNLMKKREPHAFRHLNHLIASGSIFMDKFEKLKRSFGKKEKGKGPFRLPLNIRIYRVTCDPEHHDPENNTFYLSYDDMQSLFDPVIFNIIRLVNPQIKVANWKYGSSVIKVGISTAVNSDQKAHVAL
ncbi:unnamed protein product [Penicillium pancosmium]